MIIYSILAIYESQYITESRTLIRKKPILKVYLIHRSPSADRTPTAGKDKPDKPDTHTRARPH